MGYRLIALDLDGTILVAGQPPSEHLLGALDAAQQQGAVLSLATGRPFASAHAHATAFGMRGPVICMQGALVKEQTDGCPTLLASRLPVAPLAGLIEFAERRRQEITLYTEDELYVSDMQHSREFYDLWFGVPINHVPNLAAAAGDLHRRGMALTKVLFMGEPDAMGALEQELRAMLPAELSVVRSHAYFVEVVGSDASKGHALAFLAQRYGLQQAETMAIGDSGNDVSMIKWAGMGIAMANAAPEVLSAADWVAPPVTEDGVVAALERFVLRSP